MSFLAAIISDSLAVNARFRRGIEGKRGGQVNGGIDRRRFNDEPPTAQDEALRGVRSDEPIFRRRVGRLVTSETERPSQNARPLEARLYLDDLYVGRRFTSGTYLMEEARIKEFATEFDPQPFHIDETAAKSSVFKSLVASGWHTAAVAMRLLVSGGLPLANGLVGLRGEIAWPRPTRPGDILRIETEIVEITPSRSKPQGIVRIRGVMFNQNGEAVYLLTAKLLVPKRAI